MAQNNTTANQGVKVIAVCLGIVTVILLIVISNMSSSNVKSDSYRKSISTATKGMDDKIGELYASGNHMYNSIATECAWQAQHLSTNIGITCHNNAKIPWAYKLGPYSNAKDYLVSNHYNDINYANDILGKGKSTENLQSGMQQIVDYGNGSYNTLLTNINDMIKAMNNQCDWTDQNISSDVAGVCYSTVSDFSSSDYNNSPFTIGDYLTENN